MRPLALGSLLKNTLSCLKKHSVQLPAVLLTGRGLQQLPWRHKAPSPARLPLASPPPWKKLSVPGLRKEGPGGTALTQPAPEGNRDCGSLP